LTWKGTCNNCDKAVESFFWKLEEEEEEEEEKEEKQ
jgi:hypothetical protein